MSDGESLLAAVLREPDDDTVRLVYADWLSENGEEARAEFIRVQCELARLGRYDYQRAGGGEDVLCPSCGTGTNTHDVRCLWLPVYIRSRRLAGSGCLDAERARLTARGMLPSWGRGFVEVVTCTAADWLAHGDGILARQPVRRVAWSSWPGLAYDKDCVWFVGDPAGVRVLWDDVLAEMMPEECEARNSYRALCRCRWRGVTVEFPPPEGGFLVPEEFTASVLALMMSDNPQAFTDGPFLINTYG